MKKHFKLILSVCLAAILALSLFACSSTEEIDGELEIKISVLNGTTGFGMAKLMSDAKEGKASLNYNMTVETDASNVTAALINGSVDIAALPTNAAATVYNKTGGDVKIAAVNTLGVLYLVVNGEKEEISSIEDLAGKTVYTPAQNPAFIFEAICKGNGLTPGEDITLDSATYAQPADLRAALVSGAVDVAVLPEPMVTIALSANSALVNAVDLTEEWEGIYGKNSLAQGCIVVRTEWAEAHPNELKEFLSAYKASVEYTNSNAKEAAVLITELGIFSGKAPVAQKAIPNCNIKYIDGKAMSEALDTFFEKLHAINPASVGGKLPDSAIYLGE